MAKLYAELRTIPGELGYFGEYVERYEKDARLVHCAFGDDGVPVIKIAEIK